MSWKKTVVVLGTASFFTDIGSEMIYPLIPVFLSQSLHATPLQMGIIEGLAEATASIMKAVSGVWSDRTKKRKPLIVFGYSVSGLTRPFIGLAKNWYFVLIVRFFDRIGKGIRTSPRDALVADITAENIRGQAFGLHRAMDHAGAVVGPLVATALISFFGMGLNQVFMWSIVPGILTVIVLYFGIKDRDQPKLEKKVEPKLNFSNIYRDWKRLGPNYRKFLIALMVFTLGTATDTFLLLRLSDLGISVAGVSALWAVHNSVKMFSTYFGGQLTDKIGYRLSLFLGWFIYGATYLVMGLFAIKAVVVSAFLFYGVSYGLIEPAERALIPRLVEKQNDIAYGYFHFAVGLMAFPASVVFGLVWYKLGVTAAFTMGAVLALLGALLLSRCSEKTA